MNLRKAKALSRSPQNTCVFNSLRVLPLGISKDLQCLPSSVGDKVSGIRKNSDFSFNNLSGENVKNLGLHLTKDGSLLSANGSKIIGSSSVASPSRGRLDFSKLNTVVSDEPFIPSIGFQNTVPDIIEGSVDIRDDPFVLNGPMKGAGKKSSKCVRKMDQPLLLVVGEDVSLNDIVLTNALTLVGRFGGRKFSSEGLHRWVSATWSREVSICPKVFILP